jgi:adenylate kinase family enzyme
MSSTLNDEILATWLSSEEVGLEYCTNANQWLGEFYSETDKTFHIQFTDRDVLTDPPGLHTATYHIGAIVFDYEPSFLSTSEMRLWTSTRKLLIQLLDALNNGGKKNVLPLKNFGLLPLFSTSFRAEFIPNMKAPLLLRDYAVVIRTIFYAVFSQQLAQWSYPQKVNKLHPYLLFRCTNSILKLRDLLTAASPTHIETFVRNLSDYDGFKTQVGKLGYTDADLERVYGGRAGSTFESSIIEKITQPDHRWGEALIHTLEWIEDLAVNAAVTEIARSKQDSHRADPASLAFSLVTLSLLNPNRHDALISQGTSIVAGRCEQGSFPATNPFNIDEKSRALFVPSVEVANALLTVVRRRINKITDAELSTILRSTCEIQNRLIEDYNQVDILVAKGQSEKRLGWCSDRAPSPNRIDSWVTAEVLLFFMRQVETLRWAKRRLILKEYSWVPHAKLDIKWAEIVDPDDPEGADGPKGAIERVVKSLENRSTAPIFLLYGPPGTSKTTLVEALAQEMRWDLVKLSPSDFVVESLDKIEYRARKIFKDLMNLDNCIVLMDELDSLLRDRGVSGQVSSGSIMDFVAPALLPKIQELRKYTLQRNMAVFFVTNFRERVDRALLRLGRIDNHLIILPYSRKSQMAVATKFIERSDVGQRAELQSKVGEVLEALPCTLVYRDMEQILEALSAGRSVERVKEFGRGLGIPWRTYSRRIEAYREFVAFVQRRQDLPVNNESIFSISEKEATKILDTVGSAVLAGDPEFSEFLKQWKVALENYRRASESQEQTVSATS